MSWQDESGRHEGYLAAVLTDGTEAVRTSGEHAVWWAYDGADGPRAVAVRGACGCGWRGSDTHPIDFGDDEATEGVGARTGPHADWEYHVELAEGAIPRDVEQLLATLGRRVAELCEAGQAGAALRSLAEADTAVSRARVVAVRGARRDLYGWEAIARLLELTPELALARYGEPEDGPDPVLPGDPEALDSD
ncbi:hypothetical protein ACFYNO_26325 [Kitasatospora sp. NPDC006697]|uniref:hypothetical protein n=1 Tax=Kitasatospora sp. NPDC006697 TaxID=3364020 RepID=UPI0036A23429